ncbi:MAG: aspartate carbamoyltransferase [Spirochaetes bacterium GWB1_48_6]|nr:MAG: aspartate carbamoyltransferase [Spirochaetes bacterium GWB1_48_6]
MTGPFKGRSVTVVQDLSLDEQWYLYRKTAEIKKAILSGQDLSSYKINDPRLAVYLLFLEDSTRTKESFRNAALFHNVTVNIFDANSSSVKKNESLSDTMKMLVGYSPASLFIIRSTQEGVCRHMEEFIGRYTEKLSLPMAPFLNAGDGKHEHPTQEFLDEFTFLEYQSWDRSEIHIVLVGDLFYGRTVHSKADGLKIFKRVKVDLIAPQELALPSYYEEKMLEAGFQIRKFESIDGYLEQKDVAPIWYFTRLQLERMGDEVLEKMDRLRKAVTVDRRHLDRLPSRVKFFHPLPQNRTSPTIPEFMAELELNGWDEQSRNGYFTRITLIGMVGGKLGEDFTGKSVDIQGVEDEFIEEIPVLNLSQEKEGEFKTGIKRIDDGVVIDHIGRGLQVPAIWKLIDKIRRNLGLDYLSGHGVFASKNVESIKGIISLPNILTLDERKIKMLAALSPGCTLNMIQGKKVQKKFRLHMPPRIYNFAEVSCRNENCISHPRLCEPVKAEFIREGRDSFICRYCDRVHTYQEIWTT